MLTILDCLVKDTLSGAAAWKSISFWFTHLEARGKGLFSEETGCVQGADRAQPWPLQSHHSLPGSRFQEEVGLFASGQGGPGPLQQNYGTSHLPLQGVGQASPLLTPSERLIPATPLLPLTSICVTF